MTVQVPVWFIGLLTSAYFGVTGWALLELITLRSDLKSHMATEEAEGAAYLSRLEDIEKALSNLPAMVHTAVLTALVPGQHGAR